MDFQSNVYGYAFVNEFPDDQPPATSYPDPHKPGQMDTMNPTPEVPGTDAPEVSTGSSVEPASPDEEGVEDEE